MQIEDERKQSLSQKIRDNAFIKKIKSIKNIQIIAVIFIIAIALIIYSTVITSRETKTANTSNTSAVLSDDEIRLGNILSNIDGAGEVQTMITKSGNEIVGVLIIADGAANPLVRLRLIDAASTALGVDKKIVNVFGRKN